MTEQVSYYDKWSMQLPNGDRAIVGLQKLVGYCLNLHHPRAATRPGPESSRPSEFGAKCTVVESWTPGVFEVEFSDDRGRTYAMVALKAEQLMRLHHERVRQAA
jgi:hypothetical protein